MKNLVYKATRKLHKPKKKCITYLPDISRKTVTTKKNLRNSNTLLSRILVFNKLILMIFKQNKTTYLTHLKLVTETKNYC